MSEVYMMATVREGDYERVTNIAGVKTTYCRNRFEVLCQNRAETNDQFIVQELRAWLAKRREDEMRDAGDLSGLVP